MAIVVCFVSLLLLSQSESANSAIFACASTEGTTIFQDRPCPRKKVVNPVLQQPPRQPLGIHESWFELPRHTEGRAFCDRRGCECGPIVRKHQGSLEQAVADALYMDAGWHHFETSYTAWLDTPESSSKAYDRREQMIEASCNVMISQQLLRDYANDVVSHLRTQVLRAEERGYDVPDPCDQGIELACEFYKSVELYKRLVVDAKALKIPREALTAASDL